MIIRQKRPDKKNALSLIEAAKREVDFALSLKITKESGSTIIRNIYESFRMVGDALLVSKGIESKDHLEPINELTKLNLDLQRPLGYLQNLRNLRHNLNYYGYSPKIEEVEDVIDYAKKVFYPLLNFVKNKILSSSQ